MDFMPIKAAELGLPLVRPLPTIFAYARGTRAQDLVPPILTEEFYAHVDCLIDLLQTACLRAGIPRSTYEEVSQRAVDLTRCEVGDLVPRVNELLLHLARMASMHRTTLRNEVNRQMHIYRDIYWGRVYTKKLILVHQEDSPEPVAKLQKSLSETCSYDVTVVAEKELVLRPMSADLVLFRLSRGPVRAATMTAATSLGLPVLILASLGNDVETADPVMVRTALLYAKSGSRVLYRPFTPLRLFTTIDTGYVQHLFQKPDFAGARATGEVA